MCHRDIELTQAEKEELRCARREKRSAFWSRFIDEFKKIMFIITVLFCMGIIVWSMILYTKGSTVSGLQVVISLAFGIIGTAFAVYCNAASNDKKSLNDNGLTKGKDGTIMKVVDVIAKAVTGTNDTPEG